MRICHISDWHGQLLEAPAAELYVVTGDMLPNFLTYYYRSIGSGIIEEWRPNDHLLNPGTGPQEQPVGIPAGRKVDRLREAEMQEQWISMVRTNGGLRAHLGNPDAPAVCVRGNHDFTDLAPLVGGDVWEVTEDPTRTKELLGLRFGGTRGIRFIAGEWSDELDLPAFHDRARLLPTDIDILVTHAPPAGILDVDPKTGDDVGYGSEALRSYLETRSCTLRTLRAHLFGHMHHVLRSELIGDTLFSNAAQGFMVHDV